MIHLFSATIGITNIEIRNISIETVSVPKVAYSIALLTLNCAFSNRVSAKWLMKIYFQFTLNSNANCSSFSVCEWSLICRNDVIANLSAKFNFVKFCNECDNYFNQAHSFFKVIQQCRIICFESTASVSVYHNPKHSRSIFKHCTNLQKRYYTSFSFQVCLLHQNKTFRL